ncbi:MAG TPA: triose-phosphate isomerase [Candidatus Elarobacter sp.]|jgi:triosephosphate isomerase
MSRARRPLIAGNWKMHKTIAQARAFIAHLRAHDLPLDDVDAVICPPFTALCAVSEELGDSRLGLGAQNVCWAEEGAFTGEISAPMLLECGVRWVVIGHSERRALFGELDHRVNEKVHAALLHGITPIVAVGETAAERALGETREKVLAQVRAAFGGIPPREIARCVVAYEPIWAIGTGNACLPDDADDVMAEIRGAVEGIESCRVLYGGSMTAHNAADFLRRPNIDGGLAGGASLDPDSFAALLDAARAGALA